MSKTRLAVAALMAAARDRGELAIDDPDRAAARFLALCAADVFFTRLFGVRGPCAPEEIEAQARGAVEAFLRIYRPA